MVSDVNTQPISKHQPANITSTVLCFMIFTQPRYSLVLTIECILTVLYRSFCIEVLTRKKGFTLPGKIFVVKRNLPGVTFDICVRSKLHNGFVIYYSE